MNVIGFMEFGDPKVLQILDMPIPTPKSGEVVVKVCAAPVNPTDLMMRSGQQAKMMIDLNPPYIAGMEFSGHVHSVGEGVSRLAVGQPVMGVVNPRRPEGGAHGEYICLPSESVVALAPSVDIVAASAVPMNGLTAIAALRLLGLKAGESLLVTGGAGVLAGYIIQLAVLDGLRVVADAKPEAHEYLRQLGAHDVVERGEGMEAEVRRIYPSGVDGLIDTALLGDRAAALVREGGRAISVRSSRPITDKRLRCGYVSVPDHVRDTEALQRLADLLRDGVLKTKPGRLFPMRDVVLASELIESGASNGRPILSFN